jgi:phosphoribosylaminoimidazole-succinocarboxamide synthase
MSGISDEEMEAIRGRDKCDREMAQKLHEGGNHLTACAYEQAEHEDRAVLIAEVDRLKAEVERLSGLLAQANDAAERAYRERDKAWADLAAECGRLP